MARVAAIIDEKLAEIALPNQLGKGELETWCLFCISEMRQRGHTGKTVVLVPEDRCSSPIHDQVMTCDLIERYYGTSLREVRRSSPRTLQGRKPVR